MSAISHTKLLKSVDRQKSTLQLVWMHGHSRYGVAPWMENCLYNVEMWGFYVVNERVAFAGLVSVDKE
jgi:hypothetical protein